MSAIARILSRARMREESGWLMIEIMVGTLMLIIAGLAIYQGLDGASKASNRNRNRSVASYLAQQDQERMRGMNATALSNYTNTGTVNVAGTTYTVKSVASFINDSSGTATCGTDPNLARYLKISSTVTDPANRNKPVVFDSLLSPKPSTSGATVQMIGDDGSGTPGVPVSLEQPPSWAGTTDAQGCVVFGFLDASKTYTISYGKAGYVDPMGQTNFTGAPINVVPASTTLTQFSYDQAATVTANFVTKPAGSGSNVASNATSLSAYHNKLPTNPKIRTFPAFSGTSDTVNTVFPFTDPYTYFSGTCYPAEFPPAASTKLAGATLTVGPGASGSVTVTEPAVNVTVKNSAGTTAVQNATVFLDENDSGCNDRFTGTTLSSGKLSDPGMPFGHYWVCATGVVAGVTRWGWSASSIDNTGDNGTTAFNILLNQASKNTSFGCQ
jgi:type II secretory pathway pseudopilin PulG